MNEETLVWSGFRLASSEVADRSIGRFLLVVEDKNFIGADFLVDAE